MKDNGLVIFSKEGFAQVEVNCLSACQGCAAESLCQKGASSKGYLTVKNSVQAHPGDKVKIDIPEASYHNALIRLFGSLLLGSLLGLGIGYGFSFFLPLSFSMGSIIGIGASMLAAALWNIQYFRKQNKKSLYPKIIEIIKKGEHNG